MSLLFILHGWIPSEKTSYIKLTAPAVWYGTWILPLGLKPSSSSYWECSWRKLACLGSHPIIKWGDGPHLITGSGVCVSEGAEGDSDSSLLPSKGTVHRDHPIPNLCAISWELCCNCTDYTESGFSLCPILLSYFSIAADPESTPQETPCTQISISRHWPSWFVATFPHHSPFPWHERTPNCKGEQVRSAAQFSPNNR